MANLSAEDQKAATAIADALKAPAAEKAALIGGVGDVRDFFCKNWLIVRQVLEFLASHLPGDLAAASKKVIAIGDWVRDHICPRA